MNNKTNCKECLSDLVKTEYSLIVEKNVLIHVPSYPLYECINCYQLYVSPVATQIEDSKLTERLIWYMNRNR